MDRASLFLLALAFGLGALACAVQVLRPESSIDALPQAWSASLGPVVPHDTFPRDCTTCHAGSDWHTLRDDFAFDHERETGVALVGAHARALCLRCHNDRGPVGSFAARGCAGCHDDVHRERMGLQCSDCHGEERWEPRGQRALHARGRFPLTGAHAAVACERCHAGATVGNFDAADPACEACHAADLARASVPSHALEGWTSDCQRCHDAVDWKRARFQHRPDDFRCADCHREDFERARSPDHAGGGYPMECSFCHYGSETWQGGYFVHVWFPITSGTHSGHACSVCHVTNRGFGHASCLVCHEHSQRRMSGAHQGVKGYVYESDQCWVCHPDGVARR